MNRKSKEHVSCVLSRSISLFLLTHSLLSMRPVLTLLEAPNAYYTYSSVHCIYVCDVRPNNVVAFAVIVVIGRHRHRRSSVW